jgi:holin-like protein
MALTESEIVRAVKLAVSLKRWALALLGFFLLVAFLGLGRAIQTRGQLPLPGPVIGIALIAAILVALDWLRPRAGAKATQVMAPPARWLISHLGLLFVPAGVGIMTQAALLRREWLPIVAALLVSTAVGIAVTGWLMEKLAPAPERAAR